MSRLTFAHAPPPALPLRFLLTCPAWGIAAGLWIAWEGTDVLASRWQPASLVLAHMLVLGVLGNALLGSLIQFLPVAAGSPLPGQRWHGRLWISFNAGLVLLLLALSDATASHSALAIIAGLVMMTVLTVVVVLGLRAVLRGNGMVTTRGGIGVSLMMLLATAGCGLVLLAARNDWLPWRLPGWVNLHAMLGISGWLVGMLVAVGAIAAPMLQGLPAPPRCWRWWWYAALAAALSCVFVCLWQPFIVRHLLVRCLMAAPLVLFAGAVLLLQSKSAHLRNHSLRRFWKAGCIALLGAGAIAISSLSIGDPHWMLLVAVLVIAIALPLLVVGMALNITAFLTWIEMRHQVARGQRIPGVGSLMTRRQKQVTLYLQLLSSAMLLTATLLQQPALTRLAGFVFATAYLLLLYNMYHCWRQRQTFHAALNGNDATSSGAGSHLR